MKKNSTIKEVAERAGVSIGTVDRVLHNRVGVSVSSKKKVQEAIKELNFAANPNAAILASRKNYTISIIIPRFRPGDYWSKIHDGFLAGAGKTAFSNVDISEFYYDPSDPVSFRHAADDLLRSLPSAVIIPTLFEADSVEFARKLAEKGIPYIIIDSFFEDDNSLAYYGAPLYKSGQLAAYLMTFRSKPESVVFFRIQRDKEGLADPTRNRRIGFLDYLSSEAPGCTTYNVFLKPDDDVYNAAAISGFFAEHPEVHHLVMFNSRIYLLEEYLSLNPDPERQVLGFANLDRNIRMLQRKLVTFLICWKPERQPELAVEALANYLRTGRAPARKNNYMHMDVLTAMNAEDY